MPTQDPGRSQRPDEHRGTDVDVLFAAARRTARRGIRPVDVDRVIAVAAAAAERRRARQLAGLRIAGIVVILAVLVGWLIGFSVRGADIVYTIVMFTVPALVVFRWHLTALDGGGLRPWRTPSTVAAWARETASRGEELAGTLDRLDRLGLRLTSVAAAVGETPGPGTPSTGGGVPPSGEQGLPLLTSEASDAVDQVRARLEGCRAGAQEFVASCRSAPAEANWRVLRDLDPAGVVGLLRPAAVNLGLVVRFRAGLSGESDPVTVELGEALRETDELLRTLGPRCGSLIEAFDTLHRLASQQTLEKAPDLGVVRRATSSAAVVVSGWRQPAVRRVATRNQLLTLDHVSDGGLFWGAVVRRARAAARREVPAPAGGC